MRVLVIGAGWAGLAAAVEATRLGHEVTICEASRHLGGRARALQVSLPGGTQTTLDNGQHILIGAYSETLKLMRDVGVNTAQAMLRLPLTLRYPDGNGLTLPDWRKPWFAGLDVAVGILQAKGWALSDKLSLLRAAGAWRRAGFSCPAHYSVAKLCRGISPRVMADMIEPLVVSALNTPADRASASVFLTVMRDALFAPQSPATGNLEDAALGSNMLLPHQDLNQLFPSFAAKWLTQHGVKLLLGERVSDLKSLLKSEHTIEYRRRENPYFFNNYDVLIMATSAVDAARLVRSLPAAMGSANAAHTAHGWASCAEALQHEAITTVYAHSRQYAEKSQYAASAAAAPASAHTAAPAVLALRSDAQQPAQFVFDRGALTGQFDHRGLLAFVVSASVGDAALLEQQVIAQGRAQLGLPDLQVIKTIVEKRATFACTPGLVRPAMRIAGNLLVCGDYVDGPYPATLEGAVRSGLAAARAIST